MMLGSYRRACNLAKKPARERALRSLAPTGVVSAPVLQNISFLLGADGPGAAVATGHE